jgi:hypothetical protein
MELKSERELAATREKLKMLEETYAETQRNESLSAAARDMSLRSTKRLINQLKEEIAWFEAHYAANR